MTDSTFISRVVLKNYKSIAACDVQLQPLTFLIGPNGAGKSNFLDALRLVADTLRGSLEGALRVRGGLHDVARRSTRSFGIRLELHLGGVRGHYAFEVTNGGAHQVREEECVLQDRGAGKEHFYRIREGRLVDSSLEGAFPIASDRLHLYYVSAAQPFRMAYDALAGMSFYSINPDQIWKHPDETRTLEPNTGAEVLSWDGSNVANVLEAIELTDPTSWSRIQEYLARLSPGIQQVRTEQAGPWRTLVFQHESHDKYYPRNMSDGTLRALGVLVALFQLRSSTPSRLPLVGIEEPESWLHPSATGVLLDALREASATRQVVVTSHSPELLDSKEVSDAEILAVTQEKGLTRLGRVSESDRSALGDHLYTAGELMRANQLSLASDAPRLSPDQLELFDGHA